MWTKQFYHYIVADWLDGDHDVMPPPESRHSGRNHQWRHLYARDVLSMPDKWEYPWFAAWDLAFHMIPAARIDPAFAKKQLLVLLREWYMHPNGQLPAYEFYFDDVNPPVHAWACLRVFQMESEAGRRDHQFLAQAFQRLLLNFTWWVNRVDGNGDNVFAGGFLGLDNIGVFAIEDLVDRFRTGEQAVAIVEGRTRTLDPHDATAFDLVLAVVVALGNNDKLVPRPRGRGKLVMDVGTNAAPTLGVGFGNVDNLHRAGALVGGRVARGRPCRGWQIPLCGSRSAADLDPRHARFPHGGGLAS